MNYTEDLLIFAFVVTVFVLISAFTSLLVFLWELREKKKKQDKIVFLAKIKLNTIKALIAKALIDSSIIHDEFVSVNNVLKEYDDMKEEIKIPIINKYV